MQNHDRRNFVSIGATCRSPARPYANLMVRHPAIARPILIWMDWKYNVTGSLYCGINHCL